MATQKDFRIKNGLIVQNGNTTVDQGTVSIADQISGDTGQLIITNGQSGSSFMRIGIIGSGTANSHIRTDSTLEFHIGQSATSSTPSVSINTSGNIQVSGNVNASLVGANNIDGLVLQLNGTTVVNSSRNIVNVGTISNSAFTIPNSIGLAGQVLKVPSSGTTLEWGNSTSGSITGITNFADNRLLTASGSTTINGESNLTFDGSALNVVGDISLGDNKNIYIGTSNELQLVHNGNDSLIRHTISTGELKLGSSGTGITFYNPSNGDIYAEFNAGADVTLYHNDQPKIATTSTGIDVTGTTVTDSLTISDGTNGIMQLGASNTRKIAGGADYGGIRYYSDNDHILYTNNVQRLAINSGGDISFYDDTGTSQNLKWDASADTLNFVDNAKATFGASGDLRIYHDGNNVISASSGNMVIDQNTNDGFITFRSDDGSGGIASYFQIDGLNSRNKFFKKAHFPDNVKAQFGDSDDLHIYHDASSSLIRNYTGALYIQNDQDDGNIIFRSDDGSGGVAEYIVINGGNGSTMLKHYGSTKLVTTSTGIDVTGTVTSDGLTVDGASTFNTSTTLFANLNYSGANLGKFTTDGINVNIEATSNLLFKVNSATRAKFDGNGDISFYEDTGTTAKFFWDASAEFLGIGLTNPSEKLEVSGKIKASGQIRAGSYLESFPSFSFANDTDTGMFSDTANQLEFSTGGSSRLTIDSLGTTTLKKHLVLDDPTRGIVHSRENLAGVPLEDGLTYFAFNHNTSTHPTSESEFDTMERTNITSFKDSGTWDNSSAFTLSSDGYLVEFHGYLLITTAGDYRFGLNADDATDMYIDGIRVADDYGGHGATGFFNDSSPTSIYLTVGYHKLFARFEEVGGGDSCQLGWNGGSGTTLVAIPSGNLYHNSADLTKAYDGTTYTEGNLSLSGTISSGAITSTGLNSTSGTVQFADGNASFDSSDANGYPRFTHNGGSAQIGLFRTLGSVGGMYIGGSADGFRVYTANFAQKLLIDQSGNATFAGNLYVANQIIHSGDTNTWMSFETDTISFRTGGNDRLTINNGGTTLGDNLAMGGNNIENAGTISSGAITSANIDVTGASGGNGQITVSRTSGSTVTTQAQSAIGIIGTGSNHPFRLMSNGTQRIELDTNGNFNLLSGALKIAGTTVIDASRALVSINHITTGGDINTTSGGFEINGTTVIDSSRNLTNIGTITSAGLLDIGNSSTGGTIRLTNNTYNDWIIQKRRSDNTQICGIKEVNSGALQFISGGSSKLEFAGNGNATFAGAISSGAITSSGQINISKDNPVLILNDTTSTSNANQVAYISFQDNGTEEAWIGWGSSGNTNFTINNSIGNIVLNGSTTVAGDITTSGDLYLSEYVYHTGDTDTYIRIQDNSWTFRTGGGDRVVIDNSEMTTKDINVGGTGNATVKVRHIEGKAPNSASYEALYLNYNSTYPVFIGHSGNQSDLYLSGALRIGSTAVIDYSRNLSNIGTISSSYFYSSGNINATGVAGFTVGGGRIGFDQSGTRSWTMGVGSGYLNVFSGDGNGDLNLANNIGLRQNGTLVLDSSRNLTNIGTISSGAIESTGITVDSRLVIDGASIYDNSTNGNNKGFRIGGQGLVPLNGSGTDTNNIVDIGTATYKFKDLYLSGTISSGAITPNGSINIIEGNELRLTAGTNEDIGDIVYRRNDESEKHRIWDGGASGLNYRYNGGTAYQFGITTNTTQVKISGTTVIDSSRDVTANSVLLSGLQTQVLSVSGGELLMGAVDNDDFVTNIKGFGGSTSMEFADGTINAVGSTTINHSKSSTANPILALKNTSTTNEGRYLQFTENTGSFVGQIGRVDQTESNIFISTFDTGLKFESYITYKAILPCGTDGADSDNAIDLGSSSVRFDDIYATNGTIQTSDRNLKQDIQALTDAEQRVATACKGLIRRFRWQDSVAEKDNNPDSDETARYHFGVIAQDLQDAFEAEGLDASDYGMFISSTWTDDDGVEQTRLGVRYNELLSFIITTL